MNKTGFLCEFICENGTYVELVIKDLGNELILDNGNIELETSIVNIFGKLSDLSFEFNSLLSDDNEFNYNADEFIDWVKDFNNGVQI